MTRMTSTKALVSSSMPSAQHWLNCSQKSQDKSQGAESDLSKTIANPNRQKNRPLPFLFHYFKDRIERVKSLELALMLFRAPSSSSFSSKIAYISSIFHLTSYFFCDSSNRIQFPTLALTDIRGEPREAVEELGGQGRYRRHP